MVFDTKLINFEINFFDAFFKEGYFAKSEL